MSKTNNNKNIIDEHEEKVLVKQLKEEARREKIVQLFNQYRQQIIYSFILFVILVVSISSYGAYEDSRNKKYSAKIHQALVFEQRADVDSNLEILQELSNDEATPANIRALALINYGSKLLENNSVNEAVSTYLKVRKLKKIDQYLFELSGLLALKSMIDSKDKDFYPKIDKLLQKLEKDSIILKAMIFEQKAMYKIFTNKKSEAKDIFKELSVSAEASQSLKNRAKEFYKILD